MVQESHDAQVVVIGAGMAGLTAAAHLARAGVDVLVVERASATGGRAASRVVEGFVFNLGVHALYAGGSASQVFNEFGLDYQAGTPTGAMGMREGEFIPIPTTPGQMLSSRLFTTREKFDLIRFFGSLATAKPAKLGDVSLQSWLETKTKLPRVRQFARALAFPLVYSSALDVVSADLFVDKVQRALKNPVHYLDHGWQTLVDGLEAIARDSGARVLTGQRAVSLDEPSGGRRTVGLADGTTVTAERVILATPPREASRLLNTYDAGRKAVGGWLLTPGHVACLDVALGELPAPEHAVVQDLERPRFLTTQSEYSEVAPDGSALIYTFKQLDPRVASDPAADERDLEDLLDRAQPGWRDVLVHRRYLPHIEAVSTLPTAATGGMPGRPDLTVPGDESIYLAGDWVGADGFLVDACASSARQATNRCLEHLVAPVTTAS